MRRLSILQVAFPFAPVSGDPVGGAERVLAELDRALATGGHRSRVIAWAGSTTAGALVPIPEPPLPWNADVQRAQRERVRTAILHVMESEPPDVVHVHGLDFCEYLPQKIDRPVVATLHLPASHYDPRALADAAGKGVTLVPVSASQARTFAPELPLAPVIENGVHVDDEDLPRPGKHAYALAMGRICPEKGFPLALEACARVGIPLLLAGRVFPYEAHERHFAQEIAPKLGRRARFLGPIAGARKARLLRGARCLVVPSRVPETSSLVALEALGAGTPVVACKVGALVDLLEPGVTGFFADDAASMADAILRAVTLDPARCRASVRARFPRERMIEGYLSLYARLAC